jgi:hypothetical protein
MGNTVTSSYIIDSYPLQSTSIINFYAVFLNLSAFINPVRPFESLIVTAGSQLTDTSSSLLRNGRPPQDTHGRLPRRL